jgi:hypothetical protein
VKKEYRIPDANCFHVGDELDFYFASSYGKDPNTKLSAVVELEESINELSLWYEAFPEMKLAISNHGLRWLKKASEAGIPERLLKTYQEIIQAPKGWYWKEEWIVEAKQPFRVIHGMGYSGKDGHRNAAIDGAISTIIGHLHSFAAVDHIKKNIWAMNVGCLIDEASFAFAYGKYMRNKPVLGCGVVLNNGRTPLFIPFE